MTISCSLAIEGNQLLFPASLPGVSRGRDAASVLQPQPCHWAWSITRMPSGPGSSWHAGNLLDFTSSVTRTNASGRTNFSAARLHAFSIVFQHDLLFVTAEFSPRCSTYPCKLPFSGCWRRLNLAQHLSSSSFPKGKQKTPCSGLQLEDEGHGAQSDTASFKKQEGGRSLLHHLIITVAGPKKSALWGLNPAFNTGSPPYGCSRMVESQSQKYLSCWAGALQVSLSCNWNRTIHLPHFLLFHLTLNRSLREGDQARPWVKGVGYSIPVSPGPCLHHFTRLQCFPALGDPKPEMFMLHVVAQSCIFP